MKQPRTHAGRTFFAYRSVDTGEMATDIYGSWSAATSALYDVIKWPSGYRWGPPVERDKGKIKLIAKTAYTKVTFKLHEVVDQ